MPRRCRIGTTPLTNAFGEWTESRRHKASLSAEELQALLHENADVVVFDARRFDEYRTMSIPGSVSVPGGELVLRAQACARPGDACQARAAPRQRRERQPGR